MYRYMQGSKIGVDLHKWLKVDPDHTFDSWRAKTFTSIKDPKVAKMSKQEVREHYLSEKYGCMWLGKTIRKQFELKLTDESWIKKILFNPSSSMARQVAAQILEALCTTTQRKKEIIDLLSNFLGEICACGENSAEFVGLFQSLIATLEWKRYLALQGVLPRVATLINEELARISALEETLLNTDLSQGYSLKILTELLSSFVEVESIKRLFKGRLLSTVLSGYLSLRKLVVPFFNLALPIFSNMCWKLSSVSSVKNVSSCWFRP